MIAHFTFALTMEMRKCGPRFLLYLSRWMVDYSRDPDQRNIITIHGSGSSVGLVCYQRTDITSASNQWHVSPHSVSQLIIMVEADGGSRNSFPLAFYSLLMFTVYKRQLTH